MRSSMVFALVLAACSAEARSEQADPEPAAAPDGGTDAGEEPAPPAEPTRRWAVYRGTERPDPGYEDGVGDDEVMLAVSIASEAAGTATPRALPGSAQLWGHKWSSDGAWLLEPAEHAVLVWDITGDQLAEPTRVGLGDGLSLSDIVPAPNGARFILAVRDAAELSYRVLDAATKSLLPLVIEGVDSEVTPRWSPTGQALLFVSTVDAAGFQQLEWLDLAEREAASTAVVPPSGYWGATTWSPDGRWITAETTSFEQGHSLFLIDSSGDRAALPAAVWRQRHDAYMLGEADRVLAWSPNGAWLLLVSSIEGQQYAAELQLLDMRGAEPSEPIVPADQPIFDHNDVKAVEWSPDGKRVFFLRGIPHEYSSTPELLVFDVTQPDSGPILQRELNAPSDTVPFVGWSTQGALVYQDDDRLLVDSLEDGSSAEEIADDIRIDASTGALVSMSPDREKLLYAVASSSEALQLVTLDGSFERRAIEFGSPLAIELAQWLPDSSGLVALTSPRPEGCYHGCRVEYLMLDAGGLPQPPVAVAGQAFGAGRVELQPE